MNKEITINTEDLRDKYNSMDNNGRALLEHIFGADIFAPKDITERVRTFEDAIAVLGTENRAVTDYYALLGKHCSGSVLAMLRLRIIAEALNEGWTPVFDGSQKRYIPDFYIFSDDEQNTQVRYVRSLEWSHADSLSPSAILFKTAELARYAGQQFTELWKDFLTGR